MLSDEIVEKLKNELKVFFGNFLSSIVLYGSYVMGKETQ